MIVAQILTSQILYKHLTSLWITLQSSRSFLRPKKSLSKYHYSTRNLTQYSQYDMSNLLKHTLRRWLFSKSESRKTVHQNHSMQIMLPIVQSLFHGLFHNFLTSNRNKIRPNSSIQIQLVK